MNRIVNYIQTACLLLALCLVPLTGHAQVKIGGNDAPNKFSVLELVGEYKTGTYGGLQLPKLSEEEKKILQAALEADASGDAKGLMIFNTDTKCVEIWTGEGGIWDRFCDDISQYTDYVGSTYALTGKTCFDVVMTNDGGACGTLASRTNDFESTYNFDYTFTGTGYTNLTFALEDGSVITNGIATNVNIGTLSFKPDAGPGYKTGGVREAAAGKINSDALTVIVYALFEVNDDKYKIALPIKVKDCFCCGTGGSPGSFRVFNAGLNALVTYQAHMYGTDCWMVTNSKEGTPNSTIYNTRSTAPNAASNGYWYSIANKNACPAGWHLPDNSEWTNLMNNRVSSGGTTWWTTASAFAGLADTSGSYWGSQGSIGVWWSTSGQYYYVSTSGMDGPFPDDSNYWFSVRCVQNK